MRIYGYEDRRDACSTVGGDLHPGDVWVDEGVGFPSDYGTWLVSYSEKSDMWAPVIWARMDAPGMPYGWAKVVRVL